MVFVTEKELILTDFSSKVGLKIVGLRNFFLILNMIRIDK